MDAIARKLGLSRIEVRRRNLIGPQEMPFERPLIALGDEVVLDSGDYEGLLDKALARCEWDKLESDVLRRRERASTLALAWPCMLKRVDWD